MRLWAIAALRIDLPSRVSTRPTQKPSRGNNFDRRPQRRIHTPWSAPTSPLAARKAASAPQVRPRRHAAGGVDRPPPALAPASPGHPPASGRDHRPPRHRGRAAAGRRGPGARSRQGQGVDRTLGIQPGVVGHRDDQSQILAAIQGLLRQQPAPGGVWGLGSRQIPDDLASVGALGDVHAKTALGIEQGAQIPADREVSLECQQQRLGQICERRQKICHPLRDVAPPYVLYGLCVATSLWDKSQRFFKYNKRTKRRS